MCLDFNYVYQNLQHTREHTYNYRIPEQKRWNSFEISARAPLPH